MKQLFCFLMLVLGSVCLFAQTMNVPKVNPKFGKPTKEEMEMSVYEPDTTAAAVCLYKETEIYYEDLRIIPIIVYKNKVRVKILKESGVSYANVSIPFYKELENVKATAYNVENGKMVATKMKDAQVFKEQVSESYILTKFTVPQVRVGTVIEFEYEMRTHGRYDIQRAWRVQEEIPVRYASYEVELPDALKFNIDIRGFERLVSEKKEGTQSFSDGSYMSTYEYKFIGELLPAYKVDPFVWNASDYCTQVIFEYKQSTWKDIDKLFYNHEKFGALMEMENPLKVEMEQLNLPAMESDEEKICAIFQLLKSKVKWNEKYNLLGRKMEDVLKEGSGSNADINFILMSMLKDANISAVPVVMGLRDEASISRLYPVAEEFSTFVVGVMKDTTLSFIDASLRDGYLDVLPPVLMSNRARMLRGNETCWVDLQEIGNNYVRSNVHATLTPEGKIEGKRITNDHGQQAAELKKRYREAKDSLEFVQGLENQYQVKYNSFSAKGLNEFSPKVSESSSFSKDTEVNVDYIYVNPLLFLHMPETPFKQSERKFPIEFDYPYNHHIRVSLNIPEGYSVDELPKSVNLVTKNKQISLVYQVVHQGQQIGIKYELKLNKVFYPVDEYLELKQFWEMVAEINNSMLVLKKN